MFKKQEFDILLIDKQGNETRKGWIATYKACMRYITMYAHKSEMKNWWGGTANIYDTKTNEIYFTKKLYRKG